MRLLALAVFAASLSAAAAAQPGWQPAPDGPSVSARAAYALGPYLTVTDDRGNELGSARGSYVGFLLDARVPLSDRTTFVGSLPVTYQSFNFDQDIIGGGPTEFNSESTDIGNPYLGLAVEAAPGLAVEGGVWLPIATSDEPFFSALGEAGFATDRPNFEAYKVNVVSARVAVRGKTALSAALRLRGEVAPVLSYHTKETTVNVDPGFSFEIPRTNAAVGASAFADLALGPATITGGIAARYEPEGGTDRYADTFFADALAGVTVGGLPVHPGAFVRLPVAGTSLSDAALGFSLRVPLP